MIKIVDWNINGSFLIKDGTTKKNMSFFKNKIKELDPDILLIQEGHISNESNQIEELSKELGLKYYEFQELGESHIEKGNQLCLFVLSKYEIVSSNFFEVSVPHLISYNEKWGEVTSDKFKKGFLKTEMIISGEKVNVISVHGHALYLFDKSLDDYPHLIDEMKSYIIDKSKEEKMILGGDLNYGNVAKTFIEVFQNGVQLVFDNVITYRNIQSDYILLSKNYKVLNTKIDFCTDDHALLYVEIEDN